MEERPTIYESAARRRSRTRRVLAVVGAAAALVAALGLAAAWTLRDDPASGAVAAPASSPATPSPSSSTPAVRLARVAAVEVHRGETATFRYRLAEGPPGTPVTLVVTSGAGVQVKARRLEDAAAGRWVSAAVPLDLEPGRYTYTLRPGDGAAPEGTVTGAASSELHVLKPLPPAFPGKKAVAAAAEWIAGRDGEVAFAVVDSNGRDAGGYREHELFRLASLSKAILLAASLRDDPTPDAASEATLRAMMTESDNGAAYTIFGRVGAKGMRAVAKAAGMADYEQGAGWVDTRASAADQARLFSRYESVVPAEARALARELLSGITPMQRWGIPAAAGPQGWRTYFKGGWLGLDNKLMVQGARLEKGKRSWALAVMSDENPTRSTGWDTQKGVAGLLLGREPSPGYLAVVLE